MLRSLRNRLLFSHILPLVIIIPLMGVGLVYVLETQVLMPRLAQNLVGDARLLSEISRNEYDLWGNPVLFERMLSRIQLDPSLRVMFLTPEGYLLYSTEPTDQSYLGQPLTITGFNGSSRISRSPSPSSTTRVISPWSRINISRQECFSSSLICFSREKAGLENPIRQWLRSPARTCHFFRA